MIINKKNRLWWTIRKLVEGETDFNKKIYKAEYDLNTRLYSVLYFAIRYPSFERFEKAHESVYLNIEGKVFKVDFLGKTDVHSEKQPKKLLRKLIISEVKGDNLCA